MTSNHSTVTSSFIKKDGYYLANADRNISVTLLEDIQADTLVVLDCCYAGNVMEGLMRQTRLYEIATTGGKDTPTEAPGKES